MPSYIYIKKPKALQYLFHLYSNELCGENCAYTKQKNCCHRKITIRIVFTRIQLLAKRFSVNNWIQKSRLTAYKCLQNDINNS